MVAGWKEEEKESQVVGGRLPLCEENKKPGLDLEKYCETVHGFICILHKEEKINESKLYLHTHLRNACQDSKSGLV